MVDTENRCPMLLARATASGCTGPSAYLVVHAVGVVGGVVVGVGVLKVRDGDGEGDGAGLELADGVGVGVGCGWPPGCGFAGGVGVGDGVRDGAGPSCVPGRPSVLGPVAGMRPGA